MEESLVRRMLQELDKLSVGQGQARAVGQGHASTDPSQPNGGGRMSVPLGSGPGQALHNEQQQQQQQRYECTYPPSPAPAAALKVGLKLSHGELLHAVHLGMFSFKGMTEPVSMVNVLPVRVEGRGEVREGGRVPADARPSCCQGERERGRGRVMYEDA